MVRDWKRENIVEMFVYQSIVMKCSTINLVHWDVSDYEQEKQRIIIINDNVHKSWLIVVVEANFQNTCLLRTTKSSLNWKSMTFQEVIISSQGVKTSIR